MSYPSSDMAYSSSDMACSSSDMACSSSDMACSSSDEFPAVTIAPQGQTLRVVRVNRSAAELRIRPGQTLADAKAIAPHLATCDDDPEADRAALESLAVWADCLSPVVHIASRDALLVDVTGAERLFHGEANLLDHAIEGLRGRGFSVRAAIADTPGAAWALAHAHTEPSVIAPAGQTVAYLAPLPVSSLRIDDKTVALLASVGVTTARSLMYLPRSSLAMRFGQALLDRLDQATGDLEEIIPPYRPEQALTSRFRFGIATTRLDLLTEAIHRTLEPFCESLHRKVAGVRQMYVTFHCPHVDTSDGPQARTVTQEVSLSAPTRSAAHLRSLLSVLLDQLRLPAPADALTLWARRIDHLDGWQDELFTTDSHDARLLTDLLDRLAARLGGAAVVRPELLSEHEPERAFRYVSVTEGGGKPPSRPRGSGSTRKPPPSSLLIKGGKRPPLPSSLGKGGKRGVGSEAAPGATDKRSTAELVRADAHNTAWKTARAEARGSGEDDPCPILRAYPKDGAPCSELVTVPGGDADDDAAVAGPRPLRLLRRPMEIGATAIVPEGPPVAFRFDGKQHAVIDSVGPERIETGWWRGPHVRRDYFRVVTETGRRCWVFRNRDTGRWFLHGWFD